MTTVVETFIRDALEIGAIELIPEGRKLKSGRISPYFFNTGLFNTGEILSVLADAYACQIDAEFRDVDVLFGPAYKGIPLVAAIALSATRYGMNLGYSFNRKEAKDHGEEGTVVGAPLRGKKVIVVDDVITAGTSFDEAAEIIRAEGGILTGGVIAFDRQERGTGTRLSALEECEQRHSIPIVAAATFKRLITVLEADAPGHPDRKAILPAILAYREEYGIKD